MANNNLPTVWFQDLPKDKQEDFKKQVLGSQIVLDKLHQIVYNMILKSESVKMDDYDTPGWAFKQAHMNGQSDSFNKILKLLKPDQG